jgi:hypothetical protein
MPYNETVIENIPLGWIEWYTGYGFPNHKGFKPTLPKWWENINRPCRGCGHRYFLRDIKVSDPFVDSTKFIIGERHVRFNCPKCGIEDFARRTLYGILKDQINEHIKKEFESRGGELASGN